MDAKDNQTLPAKSRRVELVAVVAFVVVSLLAPLVVGEMYPFTVSPMFRDQPEQYCTYQLFDESGGEIDLELFGLHLVYDGNPPGLGMGIEAVPRMHEFGEVPELADVVDHVRSIAILHQLKFSQIRICQSVVCCDGTRPESKIREATVTQSSKSRAPE